MIRQSEVKSQAGPFNTVLEGTYDEEMKVRNLVKRFTGGCAEWIVHVHMQIRSGGPSTTAEKVQNYQ